ncbi:winged helix-turn-helix transcriptional regulator [Micromonospora sp. 15K316]|uniref:MarR family transcriptional regulator n=1 Tax=Micromonospora sp. 15K316 TaxID=2530376 RepID=UPI0010474C31|nr:helix-turn-helix domain-containing protein [Micromonospora sp. 15K316]TDC34237.1 winged helix-turn-helix transcriptional regulator [Micromonospora sp. 15K316]
MTTDEKVLTLMARPRWRDEPPTAGELADRLGLPTDTVSTALQQLAADGKVRRVGEAFNGAWTWAPGKEQ